MFKFRDLKVPVIQAPMAGSITTPQLVAAVANAGGVGSFGFAYDSSDKIDRQLAKVRKLTTGWLNANFFVFRSLPFQADDIQAQAISALRLLNYAKHEIPKGVKEPFFPNLDDQLGPIWQYKPDILTFHFGVPKKSIIEKAKSMGINVGITATSLEEAQEIQSIGADFIVAQGVEAGGHRGVFDEKREDQKLSLKELLTLIKSNIKIPFVGAGGIMDGRDIKYVLSMGASAVQMGTAFVCCHESGASRSYKQYLLNKKSRKVVFTKSFSGRFAKGLQNEFVKIMEGKATLAFPSQNVLTSGLRNYAAMNGNGEYQSLWAGDGFSRARQISAKNLISILLKEISSDVR